MPTIDAEFALSLHNDTLLNQGEIELIIHNFSDTAALYHVYGHQTGELLHFTPESQHIPVNPHHEETVSLWVRLEKRDWLEPLTWTQTTTYPFELVVTTADGQSRSEHGRLIVPPPIRPLAILTVLLPLMAVCLFIIALYAMQRGALASQERIVDILITAQATSGIAVTIIVDSDGDNDGDEWEATETAVPFPTPTLSPPTPTNTPGAAAVPLPTPAEAKPATITPIPSATPAVELFGNAYTTLENSVLTVSAGQGVLANDIVNGSLNNPQLRATNVAQAPLRGSVALNGDGSFAYTPNAGFFGADSFVYTACIGTVCNAATVNIAVYSRLVAADAALTFDEDSGERDITAQVLANDGDKENTPLTLISVQNANPDRVTFVSHSGVVLYNPGDDFIHLGQGETATDSFRYTIRNTRQLTSTAVVNITIRGKNNPPIARDSQISLPADRVSDSLNSLLLANDSDPDTSDQSRLAIHSVSNNGGGGQATLVNGVVTYDPLGAYDALTPGQTATDSFAYTIIDPQGAVSNSAAVQVTIQGVNMPPQLTVSNAASPVVFSSAISNSVPIAENVTIFDPDSPSMTRIWLEFTGSSARPDGQAEYLQITFQGDTITSVNDFIFILTVPQPTQEYLDALKTVRYVNNSPAPTAGCRRITFQVHDNNGLTSNIETIYIAVNGGGCPTAASLAPHSVTAASRLLQREWIS